MACRPALVWGAVLAAGVAAEGHALLKNHHDCTLSALTRRGFRVHHPLGRAVFVVGSAALALWFQYHIVAWTKDELVTELAEIFELDPLLAPEQHA